MSLVITINQKPGGKPSLGPALEALETALASLDVEWTCRSEPRLSELDWCTESGVPRSQCVGCQNDHTSDTDDRELDARREDAR